MDHGEAKGLAVVQDRLVAQPEQQFLAVGGIEDLGNSIFLAYLDRPGSHGQEMQVMIAEYTDGGITEAMHEAQQLQRVWSFVDEIPGKPEAVNVRIKIKFFQQPQQVIEAALHVTDSVGG